MSSTQGTHPSVMVDCLMEQYVAARAAGHDQTAANLLSQAYCVWREKDPLLKEIDFNMNKYIKCKQTDLSTAEKYIKKAFSLYLTYDED